jgi:hypothetical protein
MNKDMAREVAGLFEQLQAITKQELLRIAPDVENIIRNRSKDQHRIESLLDKLLECAGMDNEGLEMFKRLCRYYYKFNPAAAGDYVRYYHEFYGSEDNESEKIANGDDTA